MDSLSIHNIEFWLNLMHKKTRWIQRARKFDL